MKRNEILKLINTILICSYITNTLPVLAIEDLLTYSEQEQVVDTTAPTPDISDSENEVNNDNGSNINSSIDTEENTPNNDKNISDSKSEDSTIEEDYYLDEEDPETEEDEYLDDEDSEIDEDYYLDDEDSEIEEDYYLDDEDPEIDDEDYYDEDESGEE